ncbi:MAG TPA: methylenetetrahydrofolate reductase [Caulobacteraceae bacterium]
MTSSLQEKLNSGKFVMTAEVTPPLSSNPEDLLAKALPLKGYADAVNVTDGASAKTHLDSLVAAIILKQNGIEPILQLTCRDRNRIALQSELIGAAAMGVENILVLTGDDPKKGDQPDAKPVFDLDSAQLIATAAHIRDKGELPHGRKVNGGPSWFIGVADAPIDPPEGWTPKSLAKKVEAGGQFAQTQFCMDADVLRRYFQRLEDNGLGGKLKYIVGVVPPTSAKQARWIKENLFGAIIPDWVIDRMDKAADNPKAEGQKICAEVILQLAEVPGVAGVHIMAPLNEASIPGVVDLVRAAGK